MPRLKLTSTGDTIIEVMIALAILSSVLGLAYGAATKSLQHSQQSQERIEAAKIAEGQMERLKAKSATGILSGQVPGGNFCFTAANAIEAVSGNNCRYNSRYDVVDTYVNNLITVRIQWDSVVGNGQDNLQMYYRVY